MKTADTKKLTGLRLTKSDTDGIWLHFKAAGYTAGIRLDNRLQCRTIVEWAEEQFRRQHPIKRFFKALWTAILATASNNPEKEFMENNNV